MGDKSHFKSGQFVGACLAGESVTKTVTLIGVLRGAVSKVMSAYTNYGKTASVKRNSGQESTLTKRLSYIEDCFKKSQNYCSTGDRRTEYSCRPCFHKNCLA
jgi:hypothetical protein